MSNVIQLGINAQKAKACAGTLKKILDIVLIPQMENAKVNGADAAVLKSYEQDIANVKMLIEQLKTTEV
jgi:hypothetical protein